MTRHSNAPLTEDPIVETARLFHDTCHLAARRTTVATSRRGNVGPRGWQR